MKKVKIMLLSFILLAVIGGALAFKARFIVPYCTTITIDHPFTCPLLANLKPDGQATTIFTTTPVFWPDTGESLRCTTTELGFVETLLCTSHTISTVE